MPRSTAFARCLAAALAAALLAGCVLLNPAPRLLEQARAAIEARDFDAAYDRLVQIRREHPDSEQNAEAFRLAAALFQRGYFLNRHTEPNSRWVTTEPAFMLDWFASFFDGTDFPQRQAEELFVGMHYGYFREYLAFAQSRPALARWTVRVEDDNGRIESIHAVHSAAAAP
jgi:hypothetical protein